MTRVTMWIAVLAALAMAAPAAVAETYDAEGGINWFGDSDAESIGAFDEESSFGFDSGLVGDDYEYGFEESDTFSNDEYGVFDTDYDYDTDEGWFDGWYGESDEAF